MGVAVPLFDTFADSPVAGSASGRTCCVLRSDVDSATRKPGVELFPRQAM